MANLILTTQSITKSQFNALANALRAMPAPPKPKQPKRKRAALPRQLLVQSDGRNPQIGAVVQTRLTRLGMSDIVRHRIAWVTGYSWVGDGTSGAANSVYFENATSANILKGFVSGGSSGLVPIVPGDPTLGQTYISDIEKHYARKRVNRMWLHVDSLQPSTSNNMMIAIAPRRGCPALGGATDWYPLATAVLGPNAVANVSSMKGIVTVDSWESKTIDITDYIAGGSGPKQNEFEIGSLAPAAGVVANAQDLDGVAPACFALAGNSTTAGLQASKVHQISVEQEVDYLDYIGGIAQAQVQA